MPDYSNSAPPNLFPSLQGGQQGSTSPSSQTRASESPPSATRRRAKDQMGEGFYQSFEEIQESESPSKRARTGSPSDHEADDKMDETNQGEGVNANASESSNSTSPDSQIPKATQLNTLKMSFMKTLERGTIVYLVPVKWFLAFAAWAKGEAREPGPVDPSALLCDEHGVIYEQILEDKDFHLTTEEGWNLIKQCHGAHSEVARQVIPESSTSLRSVVELRPPTIVLFQIVSPPTVTASVFNFGGVRKTERATSISISKADTLDTLESKIRETLSLAPNGQIRCYKIRLTRNDSPLAKFKVNEVLRLIPDRTDTLEFDLKTQTVGEIGIVEPYLGIAVEWKQLGGTWPMDETIQSEPPSKDEGSTDVQQGGGRKLGSSPTAMLPFSSLNRRRRSSAGNNVLGSDEDSPPLGTLNGKALMGPVLPGSYPRALSPVQRSSSAERYGERNKVSFNLRINILPKVERVRGTIGLNNLGNTCYMNAALQCLVHCKELTEYFLASVYKSELNETNPLGMNGLVAKQYALLVTTLFNPKYDSSSFPPREFKKTIGRFAPNFSGYGQQDSQEFLAFLLDGLHEDLNRVRKKPYVERGELVGTQPSEEQVREMGQRSWDGHKLRNDSVIVDLSQGMYKSTVVCPVCDVVSVTFDIFMDLSVPLPIKQTWKHSQVHFVPYEGKMVKMEVELPKNATIRDLKKLVGERMGVNPTKLLSAEVFSKKFYKHHTDNMILAEVISEPTRDDVTLYELPELGEPESIIVPIIHGFWAARTYYHYQRFEEFGLPLYLVLTKDEKNDFDKIYEKIRKRYTQFASAEELQTSITSTVEETSAEDAMEDVVLTRQDVNTNQNMVTIRVQPWHKSNWPGRDEVEMPTSVDKLEHLYDLRDFLRPPPTRMQSLAPSAMESVHQDGPASPSSIADESFVDALENNSPREDGNASEETTYLSQHGSFMGPRHTEESDTPMPSDDIDPPLPVWNDLNLSDSEGLRSMENTDREASTPSMHDLSDNASSDLFTASQLGEIGRMGEELMPGRGHAPSPDPLGMDDNLPPYSPFSNHGGSGDDEIVQHELKFGDQLICEWSDGAYQHVFNNRKYPSSWDTFETWIDPSPPVKTPQKKKNIDLADCLDEFGKEEQLGENDLWYCPRCKEHRQASKTLQLWRVPDIFAVHLKRFSSNRTFRDKLDNLVEFPLTDFDLTDRVGDKTWIQQERGGERLVYDLFAVDNHYGGLGGGHYTAYAQNFVNGEWYYYDDSSVRPANPEQSITSAAYLLFYKRRSETPLGGDTSKLIAEHAASIPTPEESDDSSSTGPKIDEAAQSGSSSPPTEEVLPPKNAFRTGFLEHDSIADMYAPLKSFPSASSWQGGWSNRAASTSSTPSIGFGFGSNSNQASGGSSSPGLDSENITPDDAGDADVESVNDDTEKFEEVLPMDESEGMEEPEVINFEDEDQRAA